MKRRALISMVGGSAVLAGCTDSDSTTVDGEGDTEDGEPEFEIVDHNIPTEATTEEQVELVIEVANTGEVSGTFEDQIFVIGGGPNISSQQVNVEIPAEETASWRETIIFNTAGSVTWRLPTDESVTTEIVPASTAPQIQTVNLVSEWNGFGDIFENEISSAPAGEFVTIGSRFEYWHETETFHTFREYTVRDSNGAQVAVSQDEDERLTDNDGWEEWEFADPVDLRDATAGEYTVELQIRDEVTGAVSDVESNAFELE